MNQRQTSEHFGLVHGEHASADLDEGWEAPEAPSLAADVHQACADTGVSAEDEHTIMRFLALLQGQHQRSYEDSLNVGLLSRAIARQEGADEKLALMSGLLHDIGKALVPKETLEKEIGWTDEDRNHMDKHVIHAFELLKGRFDLIAEIVVRSHQYQSRKVPEQLPEYLHQWDDITKATIDRTAQRVALADVYDALHRPNDRYATSGPLTGHRIKELLLEQHQDQSNLIESLYAEGVFTTGEEELEQAA